MLVYLSTIKHEEYFIVILVLYFVYLIEIKLFCISSYITSNFEMGMWQLFYITSIRSIYCSYVK